MILKNYGGMSEYMIKFEYVKYKGAYDILNNELTQSIRTIQNDDHAMAIFGPQNSNLPIFESELDVTLNTRGKQLIINGTEESIIQLGEIITQLELLVENKKNIKPMDIINAVRLSKDGKLDQLMGNGLHC